MSTMDESGVKKFIKDAIEEASADCEVTIHRRGMTLEFNNGDRFRILEPVDLGEDDELDEEDGLDEE